jgi:hypothetical protein
VIGSEITIAKFLIDKNTLVSVAVGIDATDAAPDTDISICVPFSLFD